MCAIAAPVAAGTNDFGSGAITLGTRLGDGVVEGYSDWLMPVWAGTSGLLFVNPRFTADDDAQQEYNLGLGYRHYFPRPGLIMGINGYYDHREVSNHGFDQAGAGIELLSRWFDLRANYYYPDDDVETLNSSHTTESVTKNYSHTTTGDLYAEGHAIRQDSTTVSKQVTATTKRLFEQYGQAREGFDLEMGGHIPPAIVSDFVDISLYAGYYRFDGVLGNDDIEGYKGRFELTAVPAVTIDAELFEDDDLYGSRFFIGARVSLPFDTVRLSQGRNPFVGALDRFTWRRRPADLAARMDTMVLRDLHVQTAVSALAEVVEARQTTTTARKQCRTTTVTVADDVTFVDGDNVSGNEDGTHAHPYNTVQEGVNNVSGRKIVFVFDANDPYRENVILLDGLSLYGSGYGIVTSGGKIYGKGEYPVIDGMSTGPSITLAENNSISGVRVMNTDGVGHAAVTATFGGDEIDVSRTGILGLNKDGVTLDHVRIGQCGTGGMLLNEGTAGFATRINSCNFDNNADAGLLINGTGGATTFDGTAGLLAISISDSHFDKNGGNGLTIKGVGYSTTSLGLYNATANANGASGVDIDVDVTGNASLNIDRLTANGNTGWDGLFVSLASDKGDARGVFTAVTANDNTGNGIEICDIFTRGGGVALAELRTVEVNRNSGEGLDIDMDNAGGAVELNLDTVTAMENDGDGVYVGYASSKTGPVSVSMRAITAGGNGSSGVAASGITSAGDVSIGLAAITVSKNGNDGLNIEGSSDAGKLSFEVKSTSASGNADDGAHVVLTTAGHNGDISIACDKVKANGNTDAGIFVTAAADYGAVDAVFASVMANNNGDDGIFANLEATCFGGAAAARSSFNNIEASDNAGAGASGIYLVQYSYNGASSSSFSDVAANRNHSDNIHAYIESSFDSGSGDAALTLTRVQADGSLTQDGIAGMAYSYGDGGHATVSMTDTAARNNNGYGIDFADAQAFGADADASVLLTRVTGEGNHNDGIWGYVYARNGQASFVMEQCAGIDNKGAGRGAYVELFSGDGTDQLTVHNCTFTGNSSDGIEIDSGGATRFINLGNAADDTAGYNVIADNGAFAVHNSGDGAVIAENNWWGMDTPAAGFFGGDVDYSPWLTAAP